MTDSTVEAVARAICSVDCEGPCDCPIWEEVKYQAQAAIAAHLKALDAQDISESKAYEAAFQIFHGRQSDGFELDSHLRRAMKAMIAAWRKETTV